MSEWNSKRVSKCMKARTSQIKSASSIVDKSSQIDEGLIEFYKTNIGPGAYNITEILCQTKPKFSFGKQEKMKRTYVQSPDVGKYFPSLVIVKKTIPAHTIGKASKWDEYWEKRMKNRSPGPVYKYNLIEDQKKLNKVVYLFTIIAFYQVWNNDR